MNATNEAILYAKSPEELYGKVCEAAYSSGGFLATAVFLLDSETSLLRFATGCGEDIARLRSVDISIIANTAEGNGVCGQAFRDRGACVSNDFLNDPRSLAWREGARKGGVGAVAALPLTCNGRTVGVFLVTRQKVGSFSERIVSLLERMAANVSFALDNFDHAHSDDLNSQLDVRRVMQSLKPRERELLWLAYVEGMTHQEIAIATGLTALSVRPLLFRARKKAASLLRPEGKRA